MEYLLRFAAEDLSSAIQQAQALGATEKIIAQLKQRQKKLKKAFCLNHRNWPAFKAFLMVADCWQYMPNGYLQGFDYQKASLLWCWLNLDIDPFIINKIRFIERVYLENAKQFLK